MPITGTVWVEQGKLIQADGVDAEGFGGAVATTDSFAIVGAPLYDHPSATNGGAAYLFKRDGENWTEQTRIAQVTSMDRTILAFPFRYPMTTPLLGRTNTMTMAQIQVQPISSCETVIAGQNRPSSWQATAPRKMTLASLLRYLETSPL